MASDGELVNKSTASGLQSVAIISCRDLRKREGLGNAAAKRKHLELRRKFSVAYRADFNAALDNGLVGKSITVNPKSGARTYRMDKAAPVSAPKTKEMSSEELIAALAAKQGVSVETIKALFAPAK